MNQKMNRWYSGLIVIFSLIILFPGCSSQPENQAPQWIPMFNGKNLDGWTPKITGFELGENYGNTFRVEEGILKVSFDQYQDFGGHFGHLFYKTPYSNYKMRIEYRFTGEQAPNGPGWAFRNSGIMIHCQDPATMRKDQDFPVCIEVQLLGGNGTDPRPTMNLCTPGTHVVMNGQLEKTHCINSKSETYHGDQWVHAEIEVHGGKVIRHFAEGQLVLEYEQPQLDESDSDAKKLIEARHGEKLLTGGYISLQAESHPVEFRLVEIMPLPDTPEVE